MFDDKKLIQLVFQRNRKLKVLPPEIGKLYNLVHLTVSDSELKSLPPEIGQLKKLSYLRIFSTKKTLNSTRDLKLQKSADDRYILWINSTIERDH